jgi:hypothetical protein
LNCWPGVAELADALDSNERCPLSQTCSKMLKQRLGLSCAYDKKALSFLTVAHSSSSLGYR